MSIRPLTPEDDARALALWNAAAPHDPMSPMVYREKVWDEGDARLAVLAEGPDGPAGLMVAVLRDTLSGPAGYIKLLAVAQGCRRRGIGRELLARGEAFLRSGGAAWVRFAESAPNYLSPGVDQRSDSLIRFLQSAGYQEFARTENLLAQLSENPRLHAPGLEGCTVRPTAAADAAAIHGMIAEHWPAWRGEVDAALRNDPPTLYLAAAGPTLLGFAAYDCNNRGVGWFGPMGTTPDARGRGVGAALLRASLRELAAMGHERAIIPWVGPVEFYGRTVGAVPHRTFLRFEKPLNNP